MTILLMTKDGIYASRDRLGRTPLIVGKKEDGYCVSFESFAYLNLGYSDYRELGPAEIDYITPGWREGGCGAWKRDADLFIPLGLLRLSDFRL